MQLLGRTFFKRQQVSYNAAASYWMLLHQQRRISFFNMAGIFVNAFNFTVKIDKAFNRFRCSGLYPINEPFLMIRALMQLANEVEELETTIFQQPSVLPDFPFVVPMQLPVVTAVAKLKAIVTIEAPHSNAVDQPLEKSFAGY